VPRYEGDRGGLYFEIERDGCVVRICKGRGEKSRRSETTYASEDDARYFYVKKLAFATSGMRPAGKAREFAKALKPLVKEIGEMEKEIVGNAALDEAYKNQKPQLHIYLSTITSKAGA